MRMRRAIGKRGGPRNLLTYESSFAIPNDDDYDTDSSRARPPTLLRSGLPHERQHTLEPPRRQGRQGLSIGGAGRSGRRRGIARASHAPTPGVVRRTHGGLPAEPRPWPLGPEARRKAAWRAWRPPKGDKSWRFKASEEVGPPERLPSDFAAFRPGYFRFIAPVPAVPPRHVKVRNGAGMVFSGAGPAGAGRPGHFSRPARVPPGRGGATPGGPRLRGRGGRSPPPARGGRGRGRRADGARGARLTPFYNLPSMAGVVAHFRAVHDATGLLIILYNNPGRTGIDLTHEAFAGLAALPRVVGVKERQRNLGVWSCGWTCGGRPSGARSPRASSCTTG
jgi:hypothetical protein